MSPVPGVAPLAGGPGSVSASAPTLQKRDPKTGLPVPPAPGNAAPSGSSPQQSPAAPSAPAASSAPQSNTTTFSQMSAQGQPRPPAPAYQAPAAAQAPPAGVNAGYTYNTPAAPAAGAPGSAGKPVTSNPGPTATLPGGVLGVLGYANASGAGNVGLPSGSPNLYNGGTQPAQSTPPAGTTKPATPPATTAPPAQTPPASTPPASTQTQTTQPAPTTQTVQKTPQTVTVPKSSTGTGGNSPVQSVSPNGPGSTQTPPVPPGTDTFGAGGPSTGVPGTPVGTGQTAATAPVAAAQTANTMGAQLQSLLGYELTNPNQFTQTPIANQGTAAASALLNNPNPWNPANSATNTAAQNSILNQVANPNPYSSADVMDTFNQMNTYLTESQQAAINAAQQNAAKQGVYDSSLTQGNIQDIDTTTGQQQLNLANSLLQSQAQMEQTGQAQGVNEALGYGSDIFNQGSTAQQNALTNALNYGTASATAGQTGQNSAVSNALGYGNQQYTQALNTAQFNMQQSQNAITNYLSILGLT